MFSYADVTIRRIEEKDLVFLRDLHNDQSTWNFLTDISMLSMHDQRQWLNRINSSSQNKYYLLCSAQTPIGLIRFTQIDYVNRNICVGVDVAQQFRGQQFGTKAYQLIVKYCFDYLNMHRIWLLVASYNKKGINLYKKMGFQPEGQQREAIYRDGKYFDCLMMSILKGGAYS